MHRRRGGGRVKNYNPAKNDVICQKRPKSRHSWKDSPETSTRLSVMPWGATEYQLCAQAESVVILTVKIINEWRMCR